MKPIKWYYLLLFSLLQAFYGRASEADSLLLVWQDTTAVESLRFSAFYDLIFSKYTYSRPDTGTGSTSTFDHTI